MSVNSYLSGLASNLVLSNTEKSNISTSVDTIKTRLLILSILVDTFCSRISLSMPPIPKSHNTACVLS